MPLLVKKILQWPHSSIHTWWATTADFEHVWRHDAVALLRHPLDLFQAAYRLHAEPQKYNAERLGHFQQLANMLIELGIGAVNALSTSTTATTTPPRERDWSQRKPLS